MRISICQYFVSYYREINSYYIVFVIGFQIFRPRVKNVGHWEIIGFIRFYWHDYFQKTEFWYCEILCMVMICRQCRLSQIYPFLKINQEPLAVGILSLFKSLLECTFPFFCLLYHSWYRFRNIILLRKTTVRAFSAIF